MTLSVHLICLQHVLRDGARRAGLSATDDPCQSSFVVSISSKFVTKSSLNSRPHHIYVAILPCEISNTFSTDSGQCPGLLRHPVETTATAAILPP